METLTYCVHIEFPDNEKDIYEHVEAHAPEQAQDEALQAANIDLLDADSITVAVKKVCSACESHTNLDETHDCYL